MVTETVALQPLSHSLWNVTLLLVYFFIWADFHTFLIQAAQNSLDKIIPRLFLLVLSLFFYFFLFFSFWIFYYLSKWLIKIFIWFVQLSQFCCFKYNAYFPSSLDVCFTKAGTIHILSFSICLVISPVLKSILYTSILISHIYIILIKQA